jgi:riboflavin kinase/FMN adenylyltransferase
VVVEGETFRFGRNRSGDLRTLKEVGPQLGLEVVGLPPIMVDNAAVSSTRIRESIRAGDFPTARACLGRSPVLSGIVVPGDQLGGELGAPTANLAIDTHILLPRSGIILVHVYAGDILASGLLYIGRRPTLGHGESRCEVHILDFPHRSLYGERLEIHLLEKIRDDRAFQSLDALRAQIASDIAMARKLAPRYPMGEERIVS